jgi:hypothetical protein
MPSVANEPLAGGGTDDEVRLDVAPVAKQLEQSDAVDRA